MDVKHLCLGVLTIKDATGYDIKKFFEKGFRHFFVAGYGSIYPALAELHRDGLVECREMAQDKLPDKKVYNITAAGREAFANALMGTEPRHKVRSEFLVLMYFAHMLPPEHVSVLINKRMQEMERMLDGLSQYSNAREDYPAHPGIAFTVEFGQTMLNAAHAFLRENGMDLQDSVAALEEAPVLS